MTAVFKIAEGEPCRACGAVLAPSGANEFGLCANCENKARLFSGEMYDLRRRVNDGRKTTEETVNQWLATRLIAAMKRLQKGQMVGRCEAISGWGYGNPGTQCALNAVTIRDGHKVCQKHFMSTAPAFVSEERSDEYDMLYDQITRLMNADVRFAAVIKMAAKNA